MDSKQIDSKAANPCILLALTPEKPYEPPRVTLHGTLADLTQGIKAGTSDVGGFSATSL